VSLRRLAEAATHFSEIPLSVFLLRLLASRIPDRLGEESPNNPSFKAWHLLERLKNDRHDPTLSDTIRVLLLDHLAENSYLEDREKKALRITA
jgi:hypothetical protein